MTAVEEIQAAIEKLSELRDAGVASEWEATAKSTDRYQSYEAVISGLGVPDDFDPTIAEVLDAKDAALIVTLHRTIDAQLAILRNDLLLHADYQRAGRLAEWLSAIERAGDLALALAINGDTQ